MTEVDAIRAARPLSLRERLKTLMVGMLMGAAEVVPGVSGGTIAFITGVYERLLYAIKQFTPRLLLLLRDEGWQVAWQRVDAGFLLVLFGGMGISILLFASGISYLMQHQAIGLWSFFFGLVLASCWIMSQQIEGFGRPGLMALAAAGAAVGLVITGLAPVSLPATPLFIFVAGAVAVCAWILPGISGSFILLILGLYGIVIEAIRQLDLVTLGILGCGCALGLVSFAQLLSRLFKHQRDATLAVLTGFMFGSLLKLWPWKETLAYQMGSGGRQIPLVQEPVLPQTYTTLTGEPAQVGMALLAGITGLGLVLLLDRYAFADSRST